MLTRIEKLGYGAGHMLNDLCSAYWFTYSLLFYNLVLGFSSVNAGVIMLVGQLADALATPLIGLLSDRSSMFASYGKRKSLHAIGTLGILLSMPLMYSQSALSERSSQWKRVLYYCCLVVVFQISWATVQIAHLALVTVLTGDKTERTSLFSVRNSFTFLATIITYTVTWIVLEAADASDRITRDDLSKFQVIDLAVCAIGASASLAFHLTVREDLRESDERESLTDGGRRCFKELLSKVCLYQAALVYTTARVFCNVSQSLMNMYLHEDLKLKKRSIVLIPLIVFTVSFLTSSVTTRTNTILGRKAAFCVGSILGIVASFWICFGDEYVYKTYCIYCVAAIIGLSYSVQLVTSMAVAADVIGKDVGNCAFVYGLMSFAEKFCNGLVIMAIQYLAPQQSHEESTYYRRAITTVCGTSALVGCIGVMTLQTPYHTN